MGGLSRGQRREVRSAAASWGKAAEAEIDFCDSQIDFPSQHQSLTMAGAFYLLQPASSAQQFKAFLVSSSSSNSLPIAFWFIPFHAAHLSISAMQC